MNPRLLCSIFLLGTSAVSAQQLTTIPSSHAASEAPGACGLPGFGYDGRMQVLLDASSLAALRIGSQLTSLAFRRDGGWPKAMPGGSALLTVVVSPCPRDALFASSAFASNLDPIPSNRVTVFQGEITAPGSPDPTGRTVGWTLPSDVIRIAFTTPYTYGGGNLCVDVTGAMVPGRGSRFWAIDAALDPATGTATTIGAPCGPAGSPSVIVADHQLMVGASLEFTARTRSQSLVAFLIGVPMPAIDLGLLGIGAPGCNLHVDPFASLATTSDASSSSGILGTAHAELELPVDANALSLGFRVQSITLSTPLETGNAVDCTLAGSVPALGMSMVRAIGTSAPLVRTNRAPVLQLGH